jgi:hypothetical protein
VPKDSQVPLEDQETLEHKEHPDPQDSKDTKDWLVKWGQKEKLELQVVSEALDQGDEREMLDLQDLVVDLVALDLEEKMVSKEPSDLLVHLVFVEKTENQEDLVQLVFLE